MSTAALSVLQHKRIYFAHQSVGANIIDGVRDFYRIYPQISLNVVESCHPDTFTAPVLGHSRVGRNHEPRTKVDAFADILGAGLGNLTDMALLKFCYVDVTAESDYTGLFEYYRRVMAQLATAYPYTRLIHVTAPVTVMPGLLRRMLGRMRRRHNRAAHDNLARAEYNRLLTQTYAGSQPVFDLADIESTTAAKGAIRYSLHGREFRTLAPKYSSDGRHLSETGRLVVANQFLRSLAMAANHRPLPATHTEMAHV